MSNTPNVEDGRIAPETLYNVLIRHVLVNRLPVGNLRTVCKPRWSRLNRDGRAPETTLDELRRSGDLRDALAVFCRRNVSDRCAVVLSMGESESTVYVAGSSASQETLHAFLEGLWQQLDSLCKAPSRSQSGHNQSQPVTEEDVEAHILRFSLLRLQHACDECLNHYLPAIKTSLDKHGSHVGSGLQREMFLAFIEKIRQLCAAVRQVPSDIGAIVCALKGLAKKQNYGAWQWFDTHISMHTGLGTYTHLTSSKPGI